MITQIIQEIESHIGFYTLLVQAITGILIGIGLIYGGKQVSLLKKTHLDNHDWNRRHAAQQAVENVHKKFTEINKLNEFFVTSQ